MLKSKLISIVGLSVSATVFSLALSLFTMFCMDRYFGIDIPLFDAFGVEEDTEIETSLEYDGYDGVVEIPDGFSWEDLEGFLDIPEDQKDQMWPTVANGFIGEPEDLPFGETVFSVRTTRSGYLYLKNANYGDYNGQGWNAAKEYTSFIDGKYSAAYLSGAVMRENGLNTDTLTVNAYVERYATPYYLSVVGENGHIQSSDVYSNGHAGDEYVLSYYSDVGIDWTKLKPARDPALVDFEADYRVFVYENYTYLDKTTEQKLLKIVEREGLDQYDNIYETINAVAEYITKNNTIKRDYNREMDGEANVLVAFLEEYHEGDIQHFASSATILFRALGIPARYTTGHKVMCLADTDTDILVENGHAWIEVYIDGIGWKYIDIMDFVFKNNSTIKDDKDLGLPDDYDPNKEEFKVYSTTGDTVYLKLMSYGDYNGNGFADAPIYGKLMENGYSSVYIPGIVSKKYGLSEQTVRITPISDWSKQNYLVAYYQIPPAYGYTGTLQTNDVYSVGESRDPYEQYIYSIGPSAYYTGVADPTFEEEYKNFVYQNYLNIDSETAAFMNQLIADNKLNVLNSKGIIAQLDVVAKFVSENSEYSLKYDRNLDKSSNVVIAFLRDYKEGICQHYASAATMMFRALGIPARYTVGYAVTPIKNGTVTAKSGDAHAWVEVYLEGFGWKYVEVTFVKEEIKITLTPSELSATYNGQEHKVESLKGFEEYAEKGYTLEWECNENTYIGRHKTEITKYTMYDPSGNILAHYDVENPENNVCADFVEIKCKKGTMTITPPPIQPDIVISWRKGNDNKNVLCEHMWNSYNREETYNANGVLDVTGVEALELVGCRIEYRTTTVTLPGTYNNVILESYKIYSGGDVLLEEYKYNLETGKYEYSYYYSNGDPMGSDEVASKELMFKVDFSNCRGNMKVYLAQIDLNMPIKAVNYSVGMERHELSYDEALNIIENGVSGMLAGMECEPYNFQYLEFPGEKNAFDLKFLYDLNGDGSKEDCTSLVKVPPNRGAKIRINKISVTLSLPTVVTTIRAFQNSEWYDAETGTIKLDYTHIQATGLLAGHEIVGGAVIHDNITRNSIGSHPAYIEEGSVRIMEGGKDVTSYYSFGYLTGSIEVKRS